MLFFDYRQLAIFAVVICPRDGKALTVRRGEYTGFPGGLVPKSRGIDEFAMSVLFQIARPEGYLDIRHVLVRRFDERWNGEDVAVQVVGYPSLRIEPVQGLGAEWTDLSDPAARFDVFVEEFKRARPGCPMMAPPPVAAVA